MLSIAIDGPSGAGKSTMAKMLAQELDFIYVDTGAMYRAVGLYLWRKGISSKDEQGIVACLPEIAVSLAYIEGNQQVLLNGENVSEAIRNETVAKYASDASAVLAVRAHLLQLQQDMEKNSNIIMDGRDIGTVVLPHASLKIFLVAGLDVRAQRRYEELLAKGVSTTYQEVYHMIEQRDANDRNREIAPLKAAKDAVLLDTTGYDVARTYEIMLAMVKERLHGLL